MPPSIIVLIAWLLFGGLHILMSATGLRERVALKYGQITFTIFYTFITIITLSVLMVAVALYGDQGRAGLKLSDPYIVLGLKIIAGFGVFLLVGGLLSFPTSLIAVLFKRIGRPNDISPQYRLTGVLRITRHPFLVGFVLISLPHIFLVSTMAIAVFFTGLATISIIGIPLQDRKLRRRWLDTYEAYQEQTTIIPCVKSKQSQPKLNTSDWIMWIMAMVLGLVLFGWLHPIWTYANGAGFVMLILIYGALGVLTAVTGKIKSKNRL